VQVPVYESLSDAEIERVGRLVKAQVMKLSRVPAAAPAVHPPGRA